MTIDKTIEFYNGLECYTPQAKDARDVAIDTMRKYQKIADIMADNLDDIHPLDRMPYRLSHIHDILEGRND